MSENQTQIPLPPPIPCEPDPLVVQALLDAKAALWRGEPGTYPAPSWRRYICLAGEAPGQQSALGAQRMELAINKRLNAARPYDTPTSLPSFDVWVDDHSPDATDQERQEARLRWIDQLVVEFGGQP